MSNDDVNLGEAGESARLHARIAELEAKVKEAWQERDRWGDTARTLQSQREEAQAQLRDAQGQVAALVQAIEEAVALLGKEFYRNGNLTVGSVAAGLKSASDNLPAASKAILAAAEREQGLREALGRAARNLFYYCDELERFRAWTEQHLRDASGEEVAAYRTTLDSIALLIARRPAEQPVRDARAALTQEGE